MIMEAPGSTSRDLLLLTRCQGSQEVMTTRGSPTTLGMEIGSASFLLPVLLRMPAVYFRLCWAWVCFEADCQTLQCGGGEGLLLGAGLARSHCLHSGSNPSTKMREARPEPLHHPGNFRTGGAAS